MSLPVVLSPEAEVDFEEAFDYYESLRVGLGDEFAEAVREAKRRIGESPLSYPKVWGEARRVRVKRFKYYVLHYLVKINGVVVISVFHCRRNPRVWQSRVRGQGSNGGS